MERLDVLREMLEDALYVVDERQVADVILLRSHARQVLPGLPMRASAASSNPLSDASTRRAGFEAA
jgi:hypothetical protein